MKFQISNFKFPKNEGQLALTAVIFLAAITLAAVYGFSVVILKQERIVRTDISAKKSFFAAEAGQEDVIYRLTSGIGVDTMEVITLDGSSATTTITNVAGNQFVLARGDTMGHIRSAEAELSPSSGVVFNYGLQVGEGGLLMQNESSVRGNVFSNGSVEHRNTAIIKGDVVSAGSTGLLDGVHATGTAYAHTIQDSNIEGDCHYQTIDDPNSCGGTAYPGSPDQEPSEFPISDELIEAWKADAEAGGTISSPCPYKINSATTLGPKKINCKLIIEGTGYTLTLTGLLWVVGDIEIKNSPTIKVDAGLGSQSLAIIADNPSDRLLQGKIFSGNSAVFEGSGVDNSYIVLISQNESAEQGGGEVAIDVANSTSGDVLMYASHGRILIQNSISLREVTAYKLETKNSAEVVYETGLANLLFPSGPAGAYNILGWKEVE